MCYNSRTVSKEAFESISVNNIESRERSTGLHFLIVEDNQRNIKAAQRYLNKRGDELTKISADFVRGYDEAEKRLETGRYNGVITDLFFPKKIGSNDVSLGQRIVAEIDEMAQQPDFKNKIEDSSARESFDRDFESLKKAVAMQEFEIGAGSKMKRR